MQVSCLFTDYFQSKEEETPRLLRELLKALKAGDLDSLFRLFKTLLTSIPYDDYKGSEAFFRSHFYVFLTMSGLPCHAEMHTNRGRIDIVLEADDYLYIIECKFEKTAEIALEQIKSRGYFEKYVALEKKVILLGVNFSDDTRNVESWTSLKLY